VLLENQIGDWKKICPHCHMQLPPKTANGELSSEVIAVIGPVSSGKSNFIGVLLKKLQERYAREVGFRMADQATFSFDERGVIRSWDVWQQRYGGIFDGGDVLAHNPPVQQEGANDIRIPLIFRLEFPRRLRHSLTRPLAPVSALDLFIFDAAGEDMDDAHVMEWWYPYILAAQGIIFLIDPTQFPAVHESLPSDVLDQIEFTGQNPANIVDSVIQLYEERRRVRGGGKIKVPTAFVLSKSDMLGNCVDSTSPILKDSHHPGGFDFEDCALLSDEVMSYVDQWGASQLLQSAERFRYSSFFAVSALGGLPDMRLGIRDLKPRRIADPLLWLLWQLDYIRTRPEE
jgi:hypothetical protein